MSERQKQKDRKFFRPDTRGNGKMVDTGLHHCRTRNCRSTVNKKAEHSPFCAKCRYRRFRDKHPLKCAFNNLRKRAKQRGKSFSLTFAVFESWAKKTKWETMRGKTSLSLSIHRKNNDAGYHAWNIAAITLSQNSRKQYVPFFARQMENQSYKPTPDEIRQIQPAMTE